MNYLKRYSDYNRHYDLENFKEFYQKGINLHIGWYDFLKDNSVIGLFVKSGRIMLLYQKNCYEITEKSKRSHLEHDQYLISLSELNKIKFRYDRKKTLSYSIPFDWIEDESILDLLFRVINTPESRTIFIESFTPL